MARERYVYRENRDGTVRRLTLDRPLQSRRDPDMDGMGLHERVLRGYYETEMQQKPFRSEWTKDQIKRIHQDAIARGE